jgi:hypothetical protein
LHGALPLRFKGKPEVDKLLPTKSIIALHKGKIKLCFSQSPFLVVPISSNRYNIGMGQA